MFRYDRKPRKDPPTFNVFKRSSAIRNLTNDLSRTARPSGKHAVMAFVWMFARGERPRCVDQGRSLASIDGSAVQRSRCIGARRHGPLLGARLQESTVAILCINRPFYQTFPSHVDDRRSCVSRLCTSRKERFVQRAVVNSKVKLGRTR